MAATEQDFGHARRAFPKPKSSLKEVETTIGLGDGWIGWVGLGWKGCAMSASCDGLCIFLVER